MSYIEIFLLALGLCADTLAVTMAFGALKGRIPLAEHLKIDLTLGLVQAAFAAVGLYLGEMFLGLISSFDHWVAFGLLLFIGGKMIAEYLHPESEDSGSDLSKMGPLLLAGVATSIDALAVGISLAMVELGTAKIVFAVAVTFALTAIVAAIGLVGGGRFEKVLGGKAGLVAGIVLIAIGIKILLEHLVF